MLHCRVMNRWDRPAGSREALDSESRARRKDTPREAARITGISLFFVDGPYVASGARPVEAFLQALDIDWNEKRAGIPGTRCASPWRGVRSVSNGSV
jgi:hypothetical protein